MGPARSRAILRHFGSPDRFLEATREELAAVPGLPPKLARDLYDRLHRTASPGAERPGPEPGDRRPLRGGPVELTSSPA